jgi:hypothetical protein
VNVCSTQLIKLNSLKTLQLRIEDQAYTQTMSAPKRKKILHGIHALRTIHDANARDYILAFMGIIKLAKVETIVGTVEVAMSGDVIVRNFNVQLDWTAKQLRSALRTCPEFMEGVVSRNWVSTKLCVGHGNLEMPRDDTPLKELGITSDGFILTIVGKCTSNECIATLTGHDYGVYSVSWSSDGTCLASGSRDHTIKIWDVKTERCLVTLNGHTNDVNSVTWSLDGTRLASGSDDNTIKIWEVAETI